MQIYFNMYKVYFIGITTIIMQQVHAVKIQWHEIINEEKPPIGSSPFK